MMDDEEYAEGYGRSREGSGTLQSALDRYADVLAQRRAKRGPGGPQNYWQEVFNGYLRHFRWDDRAVDKDMKAFWVIVTKHYKTQPSGSTQRVLEWGRARGVHVRQVIKALITSMKPQAPRSR